jgi:hypothetical protein
MLSGDRRAEIETMLAAITSGDWFWNDSANLERLLTYGPGELTAILAHDNESYMGEMRTPDMDFIARAPAIVRELLACDATHKFDALIAAVMELDDTQRDRILARAKELEAESQEDDE